MAATWQCHRMWLRREGVMMDGRVLALFSAFVFSLAPVLLAVGYRKGSADLAILMSMILGLPLLLLLSPLLGGLHLAELSRDSVLLFAVGGLLGPLLGRSLLYNSIARLGSSRAITIQNTAPLVTAIGATLVLAEPVTVQRWLAIAAIIVGLAIVGKRSAVAPYPLRASGVLLALMAAASFGIRPVLFKLGFNDDPDPMSASVIGASAALVGFLFYLALSGNYGSLRTDQRTLGLFALAGILHNVGFLTVNFAFNAADVTLVYPINASAPVLTFGLSYFLLRNVERLALWDLAGTLSVVIGVATLLR